MVLVSFLNEQMPTGGSNFGGNFVHSHAFAAYVFPKGRQLERDGTQKFQRQEHREMFALPEMKNTAYVAFATTAEPFKPSRLRLAVNEQLRKAAEPAGLRASLSASSSSPALLEDRPPSQGEELSVDRPAFPTGAVDNLPEEVVLSGEFPEFNAGRHMNSKRYPHPCLNRGTLKLSGPSALLWGVDPEKDKGTTCPFYMGEKNRFAALENMPGARPRTPTRSLKWRSDEYWSNPANHHVIKVTQSTGSLRQ